MAYDSRSDAPHKGVHRIREWKFEDGYHTPKGVRLANAITASIADLAEDEPAKTDHLGLKRIGQHAWANRFDLAEWEHLLEESSETFWSSDEQDAEDAYEVALEAGPTEDDEEGYGWDSTGSNFLAACTYREVCDAMPGGFSIRTRP